MNVARASCPMLLLMGACPGSADVLVGTANGQPMEKAVNDEPWTSHSHAKEDLGAPGKRTRLIRTHLRFQTTALGILPAARLFFSPTGIRPKAQGCEGRATLGRIRRLSQPQRGCVSSSHDAPSCHNPIPPFTSILSSQRRNAAHTSAIHRCAKPLTPGLVPPPANLDARLCESEALKITSTFSHDSVERFPKRTGSRRSNALLRSGSKSNPQHPVSSHGRRDTAYSQLVLPTSTRCAITSQGRRNITSSVVSRMNSASCCRNTAWNGMNVTYGKDRCCPAPGTQPRWGWARSGRQPWVGWRAANQPWALRQIPVGEMEIIAEYQTQLPDKQLLQSKLHEFYLLQQQATQGGEP